MAALATATELKARWAECPAVATGVLNVQLEFASEILRSLVPLLDDRLEDDTLSRPLVVGVLCEMVRRKLADPVRREQLEDAEFEYDTAWMKAGIWPTDQELALLRPKVAKGRGRYGTIRPKMGLA